MRNRAWRRHHKFRKRNKVRDFIKRWFPDDDDPQRKCLEGMARKLADNIRKPYVKCCNPRRLGEKTEQELSSDEDFKQQVNELTIIN